MPSEFNREQEARAYLLSEIPGVRRLGLANGQNDNATLAPAATAAATAAATLELHRITYSNIHSSLLHTTLSFCRNRGDEKKGGREVDGDDVKSDATSANGRTFRAFHHPTDDSRHALITDRKCYLSKQILITFVRRGCIERMTEQFYNMINFKYIAVDSFRALKFH